MIFLVSYVSVDINESKETPLNYKYIPNLWKMLNY